MVNNRLVVNDDRRMKAKASVNNSALTTMCAEKRTFKLATVALLFNVLKSDGHTQ